MYTKKNQHSFLNSLIQSDFLFLDRNVSKNLRAVTTIVKNTSSSTILLDTVELIKNLKQLIRLLQFLKHQKTYFLHISIENKQYLHLLEILFDKTKNASISISNFLPKKKISNKYCQTFLFLGQSLNSNKNDLKKLLDNNIFLINKINSKIEPYCSGNYKIYNDLTDFKKIIFISIMINRVFNNNLK